MRAVWRRMSLLEGLGKRFDRANVTRTEGATVLESVGCDGIISEQLRRRIYDYEHFRGSVLWAYM
jgi:hypothetical protein